MKDFFFRQSHGIAFKGPEESENEVVEVGKHRSQDVLTHGHTKNPFRTYVCSVCKESHEATPM